jgi:hypothetical protein
MGSPLRISLPELKKIFKIKNNRPLTSDIINFAKKHFETNFFI